MKRVLLGIAVILAIVSLPANAIAKTLTVAVIDTGIDQASNDKLCKFGHRSFTVAPSDPLIDYHGHGTHIAGLIRKQAGLLDYCIVAIKFYTESQTGKQNLASMKKAIQYAINIKADFINISGGGPESDVDEGNLIREALNNGIKVVLAAGNENSDIGDKCDYFPACYDRRATVVGNLMESCDKNSWLSGNVLGVIPKLFGLNTKCNQVRSPSSNYGWRVTRWEMGTNVTSTLPNGKTGPMTGTSQATGVATGKMIREANL